MLGIFGCIKNHNKQELNRNVKQKMGSGDEPKPTKNTPLNIH